MGKMIVAKLTVTNNNLVMARIGDFGEMSVICREMETGAFGHLCETRTVDIPVVYCLRSELGAIRFIDLPEVEVEDAG